MRWKEKEQQELKSQGLKAKVSVRIEKLDEFLTEKLSKHSMSIEEINCHWNKTRFESQTKQKRKDSETGKQKDSETIKVKVSELTSNNESSELSKQDISVHSGSSIINIDSTTNVEQNDKRQFSAKEDDSENGDASSESGKRSSVLSKSSSDQSIKSAGDKEQSENENSNFSNSENESDSAASVDDLGNKREKDQKINDKNIYSSDSSSENESEQTDCYNNSRKEGISKKTDVIKEDESSDLDNQSENKACRANSDHSSNTPVTKKVKDKNSTDNRSSSDKESESGCSETESVRKPPKGKNEYGSNSYKSDSDIESGGSDSDENLAVRKKRLMKKLAKKRKDHLRGKSNHKLKAVDSQRKSRKQKSKEDVDTKKSMSESESIDTDSRSENESGKLPKKQNDKISQFERQSDSELIQKDVDTDEEKHESENTTDDKDISGSGSDSDGEMSVSKMSESNSDDNSKKTSPKTSGSESESNSSSQSGDESESKVSKSDSDTMAGKELINENNSDNNQNETSSKSESASESDSDSSGSSHGSKSKGSDSEDLSCDGDSRHSETDRRRESSATVSKAGNQCNVPHESPLNGHEECSSNLKIQNSAETVEGKKESMFSENMKICEKGDKMKEMSAQEHIRNSILNSEPVNSIVSEDSGEKGNKNFSNHEHVPNGMDAAVESTLAPVKIEPISHCGDCMWNECSKKTHNSHDYIKHKDNINHEDIKKVEKENSSDFKSCKVQVDKIDMPDKEYDKSVATKTSLHVKSHCINHLDIKSTIADGSKEHDGLEARKDTKSDSDSDEDRHSSSSEDSSSSSSVESKHEATENSYSDTNTDFRLQGSSEIDAEINLIVSAAIGECSSEKKQKNEEQSNSDNKNVITGCSDVSNDSVIITKTDIDSSSVKSNGSDCIGSSSDREKDEKEKNKSSKNRTKDSDSSVSEEKNKECKSINKKQKPAVSDPDQDSNSNKVLDWSVQVNSEYSSDVGSIPSSSRSPSPINQISLNSKSSSLSSTEQLSIHIDKSESDITCSDVKTLTETAGEGISTSEIGTSTSEIGTCCTEISTGSSRKGTDTSEKDTGALNRESRSGLNNKVMSESSRTSAKSVLLEALTSAPVTMLNNANKTNDHQENNIKVPEVMRLPITKAEGGKIENSIMELVLSGGSKLRTKNPISTQNVDKPIPTNLIGNSKVVYPLPAANKANLCELNKPQTQIRPTFIVMPNKSMIPIQQFAMNKNSSNYTILTSILNKPNVVQVVTKPVQQVLTKPRLQQIQPRLPTYLSNLTDAAKRQKMDITGEKKEFRVQTTVGKPQKRGRKKKVIEIDPSSSSSDAEFNELLEEEEKSDAEDDDSEYDSTYEELSTRVRAGASSSKKVLFSLL